MRGIEELLTDLLSGDETRAEAAVDGLVALGEGATGMLTALQRSDEADQRWWAVRVLAEVKDPKSEWFLQALSDPAAEVRAAGALAFAAHPDLEAIVPLIRLLSDEDNVTAVMAVNALVKVGSEAVPHLLEAFEQAPRGARIQILRALAEMRDHRSIELMLEAQSEDSAGMQYWAQEGLERLGLNMVYLRPD